MKILVAVEVTPEAGALIEAVVPIARAMSAEIELLHVAAPDPSFVGYDPGPPSVTASRKHELAQEHLLLETLAEELRLSGLPVTAALIPGVTVDTIMAEAEARNADLIAVGAHPRTRFARMLVGSVSDAVVHRAGCAVLVVPTRLSKAD